MTEDSHAPGPASRSRGSAPLLPGLLAAGIRALLRSAAFAQRDGREPHFGQRDARIVDREAGSTWSLFGVAVEGPLAGRRPGSLSAEVHFAFGWLAFKPDSGIHRP